MLHQITIKSAESDNLHIIKLVYSSVVNLECHFLQMAPSTQPYQDQRLEASDQPMYLKVCSFCTALC